MPKLVGILNLTPDSFSDGGKYSDVNHALNHASQMIKDGADIIDIGAESTRPNATPIDHKEEWQRLEHILPEIIKLCQKKNIQTSIDTRHPENAKKALELGIDVINDVSGISDEMAKLATKYNCKIILNHNLGIPADPNKIISPEKNIITELINWVENKISLLQKKHQIKKENIIFDIGIGFGKNAEQSLELLRNLNKFQSLGTEIYVGHSRKSFLKSFDNLSEEKDFETAIISSLIAKQTDYLRVHNIKLTRQALIISQTL